MTFLKEENLKDRVQISGGQGLRAGEIDYKGSAQGNL